MFKNKQKSSLQEINGVKTVKKKNTNTEDFYFASGCMFKKITIFRLMKNKGVDSKIKLNNIVTQIIEEDHQDAFGFLIQNNYKMDVLNEKDQTAVHLAFYNNCSNILFSLGRYLIDTPDTNNYADSNGLTYLHVACYMDNAAAVEKLITDNIDINLPLYLDFQGFEASLTLLHFAVTQSSTDVVKLLLQYGASVEMVDAFGRTPLHLACSVYEFSQKYYGVNLEIIRTLLENESNVNAVDKNNNTPLMSVFPDNYYEFQAFKTTQPFFDVMVVVETLEKFKLLIQYNIDMNACNSKGDTILHLVIRNLRHLRCPSDHPIISFADTAHVEMVKLILNSNQALNVNATNNSGESLIELAVASMSVNTVKMLLDYGVDLTNLKFNYKNPIWFYHPHFIPNVDAIRDIIHIIGSLMSHGFKLSYQDNFAVLKFFVHDYDECECGSIEFLPNNSDLRCYLIHLLQYGSTKHIKHVLKKALYDISTNHDELLLDCIYSLIGEYVRCVQIGEIYIDKEILKIIKDLDVDHQPMYTLKDIETELDRMKYTKLKDKLTIYDIMVEDTCKVSELIKGSINIYSKVENFSCYKDIIKGHIAKALVRSYVVDSACNFFTEKVYPSLPYDVCRTIVDYLSNEEILNMYKAIFT